MKKLLVMCPTRGRPNRLAEMLDSFYKTSSLETDMAIYLNEDDPTLEQYMEMMLKNTRPQWLIGKRKFLVEAYNTILDKYSDYSFYSPLNDDHYFMTPQWDQKLIDIIETQGKGWGLACAEDNLTQWEAFQHPSGLVISGNIPRTLGYMVWPKIEHIGTDGYFMHLLKGIDRLYHTTDVIIEHRHWNNHKALLDANYKWVYSQEQFKFGMTMLQAYIDFQLQKDIDKLKQAMGGDLSGKV